MILRFYVKKFNPIKFLKQLNICNCKIFSIRKCYDSKKKFYHVNKSCEFRCDKKVFMNHIENNFQLFDEKVISMK